MEIGPLIETKQFAGYPNLPSWGWRIRFQSGEWSGWHKGYHYQGDAEKAAWDALLD